MDNNSNRTKILIKKMKKHGLNNTKETELGSKELSNVNENLKKFYDKVHNNSRNSKTVENSMKNLHNVLHNNLENVQVGMVKNNNGIFLCFKLSTNPKLEERILCARPGFPVLTPSAELIENAIKKVRNKGNCMKNQAIIDKEVERVMKSIENESLRAAKPHNMRTCKQLTTAAIASHVMPPRPQDDYTGTIYHCPECKSGFTSQKLHLYQSKRETVKFEYNCKICGQKLEFYNRSVILLHVKSRNVPLKLCDIGIGDTLLRPNTPIISPSKPDEQIEVDIIHTSPKGINARKRKLPQKENIIAEITISDDDDEPMTNKQQPSKKSKSANEARDSGKTDLKDGKYLTKIVPQNVTLLSGNKNRMRPRVNEMSNSVKINNQTEKGRMLRKLLPSDKKLVTETASVIEITNDEPDKVIQTKRKEDGCQVKFVPLDSTLLPKNINVAGITNNKNQEGKSFVPVNSGLSPGNPNIVKILNPEQLSIEINNKRKEGFRLVNFKPINSGREIGNGINDKAVGTSKGDRRLMELVPLNRGLITGDQNNVITLNDKKTKIVSITKEEEGGTRLTRAVAMDSEPGLEKCDAENAIVSKQTDEEGRRLTRLLPIQGQTPGLEKETGRLQLAPEVEELNTGIGNKRVETGNERTPGKKLNIGIRKSGSAPGIGSKQLGTGVEKSEIASGSVGTLESSHQIESTDSLENEIEKSRLISEIMKKKFGIGLPKKVPQLQIRRKNNSKPDKVKMELINEDEDDKEVSNITVDWLLEISSTDTSPILVDDENNEDESDSENTTEITYCHECHEEVNNLKKHFKSGVGIFECRQCSSVKRTKCSFRAHCRIHKREPIHICPECGNHFSNMFSFNRHLWNVCYYPYIKTRYKCKLCNTLKISESSLLKHLEKRHVKKMFKCNKCDIESNKEAVIKNHVLRKHLGKNNSKNMNGCVGKEVIGQNKEQGKEIASNNQEKCNNFVVNYARQANKASTRDPNLNNKREGVEDFIEILSNNGKIDEKIYKELYSCDLCRYKFHDKDLFSLHMCNHAMNNENIISVYTCKCNKFHTLKKEMFIRHMASCKKIVKNENNNTKSNTPSLRMKLKMERKKIIDLGITRCLVCKSGEVNRKAGKIFCRMCVLRFGFKSRKKYRCELCDQSLERDYEIIKKHFLKEHYEGNNENSYMSGSNREENKRKHKKPQKLSLNKGIEVEDNIEENINSVKLKCRKCTYEVKSRTLFRSHIEMHKRKDDHQCLECGECFTVQSSLERHLLVFHGVTNITKYFNDNSLIRVEEIKVAIVEENLQENQCSVCLLKCKCKLHFDRHVKLH